MSATVEQELAELRRSNAELLRARDAAETALARRNTEYGERIDQQAATIDVLRAMTNSPDDPQPVFDLIARRAAELCESRSGLITFDGAAFHVRSVHGFAPEAAEAFRRGFPVPLEKSSDHTFGRAVRERQIVHVPDVTVDLTGQTALTQILAGRSIVAVPLLRDGQPIGAIGLNGDPPGGHGYSDSQIALLQAFAEQAVIAITSAETYRALHEALEQQTATSEVLQVINASPGDLAPVFDAILEKAHTLCGAAMGSLVLFDGTHFREPLNKSVSTRPRDDL
jgi:two-component system NtrC family sensor kinase